MIKICELCNKKYEVSSNSQRFCGNRKTKGTCAHKHRGINQRKNRKHYVEQHKEELREYHETYQKEYNHKRPWLYSFYHSKARCENPQDANYHRYGGRGIKFLMSINDFKKLWFKCKSYNLEYPSIHRKDNNRNYEYSNCIFIERDMHAKITYDTMETDNKGRFIAKV